MNETSKTSPRVGIVIPAFNSERFIGDSVKSVAEQTFPEWHCTVIDDGSRDASLQAARDAAGGDARFTFLRQVNGGPSAARNAGFAALPLTELVIFQDGDDIWSPDLLAKLIAALDADVAAVAAHCLADWVDEHGRPIEPGKFSRFGRDRHGLRDGRLRDVKPSEPTTFDVVAVEMRIYPMGTILFRRSVLDAVGLLDRQYRICHDIDLFLRASTRGHFAFVDESLVQYRQHGSNISAGRKTIHAERLALFAALGKSPLLSPVHRTMLKQAVRAQQDFKVGMWWGALKHEVRSASPVKAAKCAAHLAVNVARSAAGRLQVR